MIDENASKVAKSRPDTEMKDEQSESTTNLKVRISNLDKIYIHVWNLLKSSFNQQKRTDIFLKLFVYFCQSIQLYYL